MGLKVHDSVYLPIGVSIANLCYTFRGSYTVKKTDEGKYIACSRYEIRTAEDMQLPIVHSGGIEIELTQEDFNGNVLALLYAELKKMFNNYSDY